MFESVLRRCMSEGLVSGEGFAVDASVIKANARTEFFNGIDQKQSTARVARTRSVRADRAASQPLNGARAWAKSA
jgi:hypothetical protein